MLRQTAVEDKRRLKTTKKNSTNLSDVDSFQYTMYPAMSDDPEFTGGFQDNVMNRTDTCTAVKSTGADGTPATDEGFPVVLGGKPEWS